MPVLITKINQKESEIEIRRQLLLKYNVLETPEAVVLMPLQVVDKTAFTGSAYTIVRRL